MGRTGQKTKISMIIGKDGQVGETDKWKKNKKKSSFSCFLSPNLLVIPKHWSRKTSLVYFISDKDLTKSAKIILFYLTNEQLF